MNDRQALTQQITDIVERITSNGSIQLVLRLLNLLALFEQTYTSR